MRSDAKSEIMRLMREDFDPTPPNWEGRDWYDNAEDVADKIIAIFGSEKPTQVSDSPPQIIIDAYLGISVLRTMCKKARLTGGKEASDQLIERMEAEYPGLPGLSALRYRT